MTELEQTIGNEGEHSVVELPDSENRRQEKDLNFKLFAEILSVGFNKEVNRQTINSLTKHGIIHPLICPRTGIRTLRPTDFMPAYIAICIKRLSGFTQWVDVARVMAMEGPLKNGYEMRSSYPWLRIAWQANRKAGIGFDNYPLLTPILETL